ncbi:ABC transporter permease [Agaribacterium haliotis]|uniref:ABC transporter permease n=1 Tax=Agaribacterium haliotis TaxID=2013869 RepID=UPI000BB55E41|nr:FtsX-like permease family protein [Agaribacterium haliotis]
MSQHSRVSVNLLLLAFKLMLRDWRGGGLSLLLLSSLLAVATVSSISLFNSRIHNSIYHEAAVFMAADASVLGSLPAPPAWGERATELGLRTASSVDFSSMVFSDTGMALAQVKAVTPDFPLLGALEISQQGWQAGKAVQHGPAPGELWLAPRLAAALGVEPGAMLAVGEAELLFSALIQREPDQGQSFFGVAPRAMMAMADVEATEVIQQGSRINYNLMLAGDQTALADLKASVASELGPHRRWLAADQSNRSVSQALARAEKFLLLAGSLGVLLGCAAIALAARRYALAQFKTVALLKTFGLKPAHISALFMLMLAAVALVAMLLGSLFGWAMHWLILAALKDLIQGEAAPPSWSAYGTGLVTGFVALAAFAAPPILALRKISPATVLNSALATGLGNRAALVIASLAVLLLIYFYSGDVQLTLALLIAALGALLMLWLLSSLLIKSSQLAAARLGSGWRLGLNNLQRHRHMNATQMGVFASLLMLIALLFSVRTELINKWQAQLPERAANHFVFNMQAEQLPEVQGFFDTNGIDYSPFYPMTRGRIVAVNGVDAKELVLQYAEQKARYEREVNLTSSAEMGADNTLISGRWWSSFDDKNEPLLISVEKDYADGLDAKVGDVLSFTLAGQELSASIASVREVKWDSMNPNFFVIFNKKLGPQYGANWLSSFYLDKADKPLLAQLSRKFPTFTVIELDQTINQLRSIVAKISQAIEFIFILILLSGILVLIASIQASLDLRLKESAILRSLGASKNLLRSTLLIEFSVLGFCAGVLALVGNELALFFLQSRSFSMAYSPFYMLWLVLPLAGALLIATVGWLSTRKVVKVAPMSVLRG